MNVLMVTGAMDSGGAETHVLELASALTRMGHCVTVASSGGRLVLPLARAGVAHVRLPLTQKTPFAVIKSARGLMQLMKKNRFHIVHAHTRISAVIAYFVCLRRGMGMVSTVHAHFKSNLTLRRISRWGDRVIAVSDDLREYMIKNASDVLPENVTVIPNGIDTSRFRPRKTAFGKKIVFVSRLDSDCSRAAYTLCESADKIAKEFPDSEIVIGGGGSEFHKIARLADKINSRISRRMIRVIGEVRDVASLLADADLFVGVSRAALEAMSSGVPVILAGNEGFGGIVDVKGLTLYEQSNFCARGCSPVTAQKMTAEISRAFSMSVLEKEELCKFIRRYVCEYHSVEGMAERTERVYRNLYEERAPKEKKGGALLCGYYGFGNMGDDVLLARAISQVRQKYPFLSVCALTAAPYACRRKFGVRCVSRSSFLGVLREIGRAEVVVFGGGTLLQNATSRRSLWYYLLILRFAEAKGKRVELWGNGVDKIKGKVSRRATADALSKCAFLGLRDRDSVREVCSLVAEFGKRAPCIRLESDLAARAFDESQTSGKYVLSRFGISERERFVAVALRGVESRENVRRLGEFLHALVGEGMKLVFVVMYPDEDLKMTRKMCEYLGGVLAYPIGAADVQAIMRRCCLVCSMRYHALVFAHAVGTPFIGFGDSEKIRRFCRDHSL